VKCDRPEASTATRHKALSNSESNPA